MAPWVRSRNYFLYLQVVKGLLYLWELKIMHRGKQGLELELLKLIHETFFQSSEKTPVLVIEWCNFQKLNISITEDVWSFALQFCQGDYVNHW